MISGPHLMPFRNREIDFLRGIAIILVLFRHRNLNMVLYRGGWVGVDLFFVLSGFLVSNLLFNEYKRFGNVKPLLFLARRGFKIYPSYYLIVAIRVLFLVWLTWDGKSFFYRNHVWNTVFFVQNYWPGICGPTWSLAVEEHFYVLLALIIWLTSKLKLLERGHFFPLFCLGLLILVLTARLLTLHYYPISYQRNIFPTHLRLDSLVAGVILAWFHCFRAGSVQIFYSKIRYWAWPSALVMASTAFWLPVDGWYMVSFGYTINYLAFGFILLGFIYDPLPGKWLQRIFTKWAYALVWQTGRFSYNIYLWHAVAQSVFLKLIIHFWPHFGKEQVWHSVFYFVFSFGMGILATVSLENYFLTLRNRLAPTRVLTE